MTVYDLKLYFGIVNLNAKKLNNTQFSRQGMEKEKCIGAISYLEKEQISLNCNRKDLYD